MPAQHWQFKTFVIIVLFLLFLLASASGVSANDEPALSGLTRPKSILILNSYDQSMLWTRDQNIGINQVLNSDTNGYSVYTEYMDWKELPDAKNIEQLRDRFFYKYSNKKIDVIITTDDAALKFALDNRDSIFSGAPVIFSGVNETSLQGMLEEKAAVTGVVETIDPVGTLDLAIKINPGIKKVYVLYDTSESGLSSGNLTIEAIRRSYGYLKVIPLTDNNIYSLFSKVRKATPDSVIICSSYSPRVGSTKLGFYYFYRKLSEASPVPIYSLYDFTMGTGVVGGEMLSGRQNGAEAAKLALKVLNGEKIEDLPIVMKKLVSYKFDYTAMQRFRISLDNIPKDSTIINKPFNYFEENRGIIYASLAVTVILLCFITVLLFYLKKVNAMKKVLSERNSELTGLYRDLSAADDKLRQQYDELVRTQNDLSDSEYKYELLFDKMLNGLFIFEPIFNAQGRICDMRFLKVNPGFFNQTGLPQSNVAGKTWTEVFGFPNQELSIFQNLLETGRTEPFEAYNSRTGIYNLLEAFLISENQVAVVFENITGYKMAIKEVRKLNAELEKRVAERTAELEGAIRELEAFSYTVSHDLKSPLRAVEGYTNILIEDISEKLDEDSLQILKNISTISKESIEMINKMLQYSKTARAVINREEVDMEKMIYDVYNELRLAYPERNVSLVVDSRLPHVSGDRVMIKLLLRNVLSNALKFTRGVEKAVITAGSTITAEEYVFYIRDNGVGFDMKYADKLFGVFQRLHTAEEFEGSGIGLVTVKKIIEKHGGRVWIESKVNQGTSVYFTFPFAG